MVKTLPLETSPSMSSYRSASSPVLVLLTGRSRWPQAPSVSLCVCFDFSYFFTDSNTNFKNSYPELGVSEWSEPHFFGFLMKCSI